MKNHEIAELLSVGEDRARVLLLLIHDKDIEAFLEFVEDFEEEGLLASNKQKTPAREAMSRQEFLYRCNAPIKFF